MCSLCGTYVEVARLITRVNEFSELIPLMQSDLIICILILKVTKVRPHICQAGLCAFFPKEPAFIQYVHPEADTPHLIELASGDHS